ncbi:AsnC family transcriptional regulator [Streptomyces cyaneochromogenes]|uniref:AsnC family transcriptional regulator n=1 Tax=Streptomyces cyaneochromogenes TaxID=2496836 RepID=UPI001E584BF8|nr:AsnC family transcriptional regulator [Streptomyces cyaneochromogenes]
MDAIDEKIIAELTRNARISHSELAGNVLLSRNAVHHMPPRRWSSSTGRTAGAAETSWPHSNPSPRPSSARSSAGTSTSASAAHDLLLTDRLCCGDPVLPTAGMRAACRREGARSAAPPARRLGVELTLRTL